MVRKIFTFYISDVILFKCPFPGSKEAGRYRGLTWWMSMMEMVKTFRVVLSAAYSDLSVYTCVPSPAPLHFAKVRSLKAVK